MVKILLAGSFINPGKASMSQDINALSRLTVANRPLHALSGKVGSERNGGVAPIPVVPRLDADHISCRQRSHR